jgi:hypothetical protein
MGATRSSNLEILATDHGFKSSTVGLTPSSARADGPQEEIPMKRAQPSHTRRPSGGSTRQALQAGGALLITLAFYALLVLGSSGIPTNLGALSN